MKVRVGEGVTLWQKARDRPKMRVRAGSSMLARGGQDRVAAACAFSLPLSLSLCVSIPYSYLVEAPCG
jgi:hypothetical protein